jgi:hypothetical protein
MCGVMNRLLRSRGSFDGNKYALVHTCSILVTTWPNMHIINIDI